MLDGPSPLDETMSDAAWLAAFDAFAEQDGTYESLDARHSADASVPSPAGTNPLVHFSPSFVARMLVVRHHQCQQGRQHR